MTIFFDFDGRREAAFAGTQWSGGPTNGGAVARGASLEISRTVGGPPRPFPAGYKVAGEIHGHGTRSRQRGDGHTESGTSDHSGHAQPPMGPTFLWDVAVFTTVS